MRGFTRPKKSLREPLKHTLKHKEYAAKDCTKSRLHFVIWKKLSSPAVVTKEQLLKDG